MGIKKRLRKFFGNKRGGFWQSIFGNWFLDLAVLIIILAGAYVVLTGKMSDAIEYVKNLFRFGR